MKYQKLYNLEPGDGIVEPLFQTGLSMHHAIYLGSDDRGIELIAENHKSFGVRVVEANTFFRTVKRIERITKFIGTAAQRKLAIERALALRGRPYDLLGYNCEHYANEVQSGSPTSAQVRNGVFLFFLIIILMLLKED